MKGSGRVGCGFKENIDCTTPKLLVNEKIELFGNLHMSQPNIW